MLFLIQCQLINITRRRFAHTSAAPPVSRKVDDRSESRLTVKNSTVNYKSLEHSSNPIFSSAVWQLKAGSQPGCSASRSLLIKRGPLLYLWHTYQACPYAALQAWAYACSALIPKAVGSAPVNRSSALQSLMDNGTPHTSLADKLSVASAFAWQLHTPRHLQNILY